MNPVNRRLSALDYAFRSYPYGEGVDLEELLKRAEIIDEYLDKYTDLGVDSVPF